MKSSYLAYTEDIYAINMGSPLLLALNMLTSNEGIYRLTVVDSARRVKGVLSGLRLLEVLAGIKAEGIKKRAGKGLEPLLAQPVHLFVNEYLHKLSSEMPVRGLISYMVENKVGHIVLVDQANILSGVVTEGCILGRIPASSLQGHVSDVMTTEVRTVRPDESLLDAAKTMSYYGIRRLPVVDGKGIHGILTVTDLLRHITASEFPIRAVLSKGEINRYLIDSVAATQLQKPPMLRPQTELCDIAKHIVGRRSTALPIVDSEGKLVGIVSPRDVLTKSPVLVGLDAFVGLLSSSSRTGLR